MPGDSAGHVFRFGVFEANEAAGELRKHGVRIKLHSQPFKVLLLLLERPMGIVTREEMRERLWGAETFVDFDHGLNTAVNKIREALGDSASTPRYVETVSGKGYRFLAPVTADSDPGKRANPAPEPLGAIGEVGLSAGTFLTTPDELPAASRMLVRTLLLLIQMMYLAFYIGALANLTEIDEIFLETSLPHPAAVMLLLVTTAAVLIPVRLFIVVAVALDFRTFHRSSVDYSRSC